MKSLIRMMLVTLLAAIAAGCATGPAVIADYDRTANFNAYRTFAFFEQVGTDADGYESLVTQTLKAAVRREMDARGYTYAEANPDLLINFKSQLAQQTRISQMPAGPMYGGWGGWGGWGGYGRHGYGRHGYGGWGGWGGYGGWGYDTYVDQYLQGTLNIDIVDAKRKQLVWEGIAVDRVTNKQRQNRQAAITAAVAEIFSRYPFRASN